MASSRDYLFVVMTLNAGGPNDGPGSTIRRRHAIFDMIQSKRPDIVFVQELGVKNIRGKAWIDEDDNDYSLPSCCKYTGGKDVGIIYDKDRVLLNDNKDVYDPVDKALKYPARGYSTETLRERFIRLSGNVPSARMCARQFTLKSEEGTENKDIVCISWHGWSNNPAGGAMERKEKKKLFKCYMEFLEHIKKEFKLPFIIAGDYNIGKSNISEYIQNDYYIDSYEQSGRRHNNPIDYFISYGVKIEKVHGIHWKEETKVKDPNNVLDHDPIIGKINIEDLKSYRREYNKRETDETKWDYNE